MQSAKGKAEAHGRKAKVCLYPQETVLVVLDFKRTELLTKLVGNSLLIPTKSSSSTVPMNPTSRIITQLTIVLL